MEESEVDLEVEEDSEADPEEHIEEASSATTTDEDSSHARGRNALFARRKDAGLPTTQTKNAKMPVRSSSLRYTSQVHSPLRTSPYILQNTKGSVRCGRTELSDIHSHLEY